MAIREGQNVRRIREAVRRGRLEEPFNARQINVLLGIGYGGKLLAKHRVGNTTQAAEHFIRVSVRPSLYCLARPDEDARGRGPAAVMHGMARLAAAILGE